MSLLNMNQNPSKNAIMAKISLDGVGSLTDQIRRVISEGIISGVLQSGDQLPAEVTMAEQYNISRQTVHKAMSALAKDGIVTRRKKAGTIIAEQKTFMLPLHDISADIEANGQTYHFEIGTREIFINGENRFNWDKVDKGARIECITCLHFADDKPIQLEIRMVNLEMAATFEDESFTNISPTKWLFQQIPWSNVEHEISAVSANQDIAEKLNCQLNQPCLVIQRTTSYKDQTITFTSLISVGGKLNLKGTHTPIS